MRSVELRRPSTPQAVREERREEEREAGLTREILAEVGIQPSGNFDLDWIRFMSAQLKQVRTAIASGVGEIGSDAAAWEMWARASQDALSKNIANRKEVLFERKAARTARRGV